MLTLLFVSLLGAILSIALGTFWYSEVTPMGRLHMKYLGFDKLSAEEKKKLIEQAKPTMWKTYLAQTGLSLLTSFAVVFITIVSIRNGLPFTIALGFVVMNWLCFMVPVVGSATLWGNVDRKIALKKFLFDILSNLVTVLIIAIMASFFA